ncbi:MAG: glycosyltransferase family 1 protein [Desulfobacterales bacterium]
MKIALATDAWHPQISGVFTTLTHTIAHLRRMGHTVLTIHPGYFATIPCPTYPQIRLAINPWAGISRMMDRFEPDAIHIVTEGPIGLCCRQYCTRRALGFTSSFTTRFDEYIEMRSPVPGRLVFRLMKWFHGASVRVMAASLPLKRELAQKGIDRTVLWPRGVDTDLLRIRDKGFISDPRPVFLYVGRVAVEKNIEAFLELYLPGTKYVVGDGPQLKRLVRTFPKVRFVGAKTGETLARYYAAADAFVFPSRTDTFGIVMLEALACGVPVAGYPVRGPADIIQSGETGYVDEDLQGAALRALELDPQKCRAFAKQFSWEKSAERFVDNLVPVMPIISCYESECEFRPAVYQSAQ